MAWNDIVKGYEYEKGHFVVLDKEDFAAAALEKTRRIDVLDFVEAQAIDDRYFDKPYYLTAKKGGEVAYALLARGHERVRQNRYREVHHAGDAASCRSRRHR